MQPKHEGIRGPRLFYCLIDLQASFELRPALYIVPSDVIAKAVHEVHQKWLANPGKNGHVRQDSSFRRLLTDHTHLYGEQDNPYPAGWMDQYRDAWHLLGLAPTDPDRPVSQE